MNRLHAGANYCVLQKENCSIRVECSLREKSMDDLKARTVKEYTAFRATKSQIVSRVGAI